MGMHTQAGRQQQYGSPYPNGNIDCGQGYIACPQLICAQLTRDGARWPMARYEKAPHENTRVPGERNPAQAWRGHAAQRRMLQRR